MVATILIVATSLQADTSVYDRLADAPITSNGLHGDSVIDRIQRRGLLEVGVSLFEPWIMCGVEGDLVGYEIDVARELAEDLGVHVRFVRTDWYFIIPELIDDHFDLIISGMGITPARSLLINFTIPYAEFGTLIVINSTLLDEPYSQAGLNAPEVIVGARAGTIPAQVAVDYLPNATLRLFDADTSLLAAIVGGEIHAVVVDQIKATRWIDTHPDTLLSPFELLNKVPEAIAMRKGDFDGLNVLNSWIEHHESSGFLQERRHYWFDTKEWENLVTTEPDVASRCIESFE